jgi:hypothetical protein
LGILLHEEIARKETAEILPFHLFLTSFRLNSRLSSSRLKFEAHKLSSESRKRRLPKMRITPSGSLPIDISFG